MTTSQRIRSLFEDLVVEHPNDWDYYRAVCDEVLMWHEGRNEPHGTYYRENQILKEEVNRLQSKIDLLEATLADYEPVPGYL